MSDTASEMVSDWGLRGLVVEIGVSLRFVDPSAATTEESFPVG